MSFLTLTTDFGLEDGYVGAMKGVIWEIFPEARIADISHSIPPQNLAAAGIVLLQAAPYFPEGTVHVVVVDPGVGTARRPIAARIGRHFFVAPDNGVLTPLYEDAEARGALVEVVHLNRETFYRHPVSGTFHGRDIFAPCAAHLARGIPLNELGETISDFHRIPFPKPIRDGNRIRGKILAIDHFGNLATNIRPEDVQAWLDSPERFRLRGDGFEICGLNRTFGERAAGEAVMIWNSMRLLEIAVVNGSAAERFHARVGDGVTLTLSRCAE